MAFRLDLSPLERSSQNVARGLSSVGGSIADILQSNQQQEQQEQMQGLMQQAAAGDKQAIEKLYSINPEIAQQFEQRIAGQQQAGRESEDRLRNEKALATSDVVEKMHFAKSPEEMQLIFDAAVDDDRFDIDEEDRQFFTNENARKALITQIKGKEYADALFGGGGKFEQGKGNMEGFSFNPTDGTYSINPNLKAKLEEIKSKPTLDFKDRQSLNKDFTALTKDTKLIRNTAEDLEKLSKVRSGPGAIAMIFKFMKALDPTSVVRESEFATAESAAGMPEVIKNAFDKVWAGERLGDEQMRQFVETAKILANSAIDSSSSEITSFLDTFEDTIPKSFRDSLLKRIPKRFNIAEPEVKKKLTDEDLLKKYGG